MSTLHKIESILGAPAFITGVMIPRNQGDQVWNFDLSHPRFGKGKAAYWTCLLDRATSVDPVRDIGRYCAAIDAEDTGDWVLFMKCDQHRGILCD